MDPKLQTSFIPRKSAVDAALPNRNSVGIFTLISVCIFLLTGILVGGLFFYKHTLITEGENLQKELNAYEVKIREPIVGELLTLNSRLNVGSERLANHLAVSSILEVIGENTIQDLRWSSFNFQVTPAGLITMTMNGQARTFAAIALQADIFSADTALVGKAHFKNALFSDLALDANGNPGFSLKTEIIPRALSYEASVVVAPPVADAEGTTSIESIAPTP